MRLFRKVDRSFNRANVWETPRKQGSGRCGSVTLPASGGELEVFSALITCCKYQLGKFIFSNFLLNDLT